MTLTESQLAKACYNNPIYKQQLGDSWLGYKVSHAAIDSAEFAQAAADFQATEDTLTIDGMWGPQTNTVAGTLTLSPSQVAYAIERNPYWKQQLGSEWVGDKVSPFEVNSPEFAEDIYAYQEEHELSDDGICGPDTNAHIAGHIYVPPVGTDYVLINGEHVSCNFKTVSPDEPGAMVFTKGFYNEGLLKPTMFVLHWDGCKSSRSCYDVLCARGLSVLFMLDADATIYQGVDPAKATCWHAGSVNRISWGVEICNPVYLRYQNTQNPRPITTMGVRNDTSKILGFYPEQIEATVKLCHWVCDYAGIPKQLPRYKDSESVYNSYIRGPGDKWLVNGFKGVVGHFHQDDNKCDPGMSLWAALIDSGFQVVAA